MSKLYEDITKLIGNTPLVRLNKVTKELPSEIYAKLEYFNPTSSIKDRAAYSMLQAALNEKKIDKNTKIIEPTSGNMGIGLALSCAVFDLELILTMPESMSEERKKILEYLGAKLILTPKEKGMQGAVNKACLLCQEIPNSFMPSQFENKNNAKIHEIQTAQEIIEATEGRVDIIVAGIGTGGTISGVGKRMKEYNPNVKIVGVEPYESPLLTKGESYTHGIQGIGANFVPKILNKKVIDKIITIKTQDAINMAKILAKNEGILCGISSGACIKGAIEIAKEHEGKMIVAICPDTVERYLSCKELFD